MVSTVVWTILILGTAAVGPAMGGPPARPGRGKAGAIPPIANLPGAPPFGAELSTRLAAARAAEGPKDVRTRHLLPDGTPRYTNRLILTTSPYLHQHAHNPVNWYPWGDEAFEAARKLGRPILLSVGYSTCHWCHVMEHESFEDEEIARYLNEHYIPIKVDREERPDVDAVYMSAVQMLTGRGGWPMTVWLTPEGKPFYGGTYFPARDGDRGARMGFLTLLKRLSGAYDADGDRVAQVATELQARIRRNLAPPPGEHLPGEGVLESAAGYYASHFDPTRGGVRGAPKFPSSLPVRFLLRRARDTGDSAYLQMAAKTLEEMARGGMYDQIGGGFHRYSVDDRWLVPHFEKMLYDQALLAVDYLEGYQATGNEELARVAREVLEYVAREMTSPEGGFYSATDADSPGPEGHAEEGLFFTWTPAEIEAAVGKRAARLVELRYGVTADGNFEGRSILYQARTVDEAAKKLDLPPGDAERMLDEARKKLYRVRARRPAPFRDDKILTGWNGLMISAFAFGGLVLDEPALTGRARDAASFLLEKVRREGRLFRSYRGGRAAHAAYLEDHAFLIAGLLDLYESEGDPRWVEEAKALQRALDERYRDEAGGYFATASDHEELLAREKPAYDGAVPSGNSAELLNLLRLYEFTLDETYRARADELLRAFQPRLERAPATLSWMLLGLEFRRDSTREIVIVTPGDRAQADELLEVVRKMFLPSRVLALASASDDLETYAKSVPLLEGKRPLRGRPTAFVCEQGVCRLPATDPAAFRKQLLESPEKKGTD